MITEIAASDLTVDEARESVDRTKRGLEAAAEEVVRQINGRAWLALGYESWDEMREAEYGGAAVIVPRADRPQLTARLAAEGLGQRQIGDTLGVSQATVSGDLRDVINSDNTEAPETRTDSLGREQPRTKGRPSPEPNIWVEPEVVDAELVDEPAPPKTKRRPLPEAFADAGRDLTRAAERLARLTEDDRFTRNRDQTHHQVPDLLGALEHTAQLVTAMRLNDTEASEEARRWWATSLNTISDTLRDVAHSIQKEQ